MSVLLLFPLRTASVFFAKPCNISVVGLIVARLRSTDYGLYEERSPHLDHGDQTSPLKYSSDLNFSVPFLFSNLEDFITMDTQSLFNVEVSIGVPLHTNIFIANNYVGQSGAGHRRSQRNWPHDLRRLRHQRSNSIHLVSRCQGVREGRAGAECYWPGKGVCHSRRLLQGGGMQETSRGDCQARKQ
jgi:hypothetical protein